MPVNAAPPQAPPVRLQPMPPPTPATTAPSSTTATPDSLLGDESPLLRFVPADMHDLQLAAEAMGPVGTSQPLDAEAEASSVRVLDTLDRVIGEGIQAFDLTGSDDAPLRPDEARVALEMVDVIERLSLGESPSATPGSPADAMVLELNDAVAVATAREGAPLTTGARYRVILDRLGEMMHAVVHNDSDSRMHRILSNGVHSVVHTGLVVGTLTVGRQFVGYATEHLLRTHQVSDDTRTAIAFASMALGPGLLACGLAMGLLNRTETTRSAFSRLFMILTAGASMGLLYASGGMPQMASFGPQATFYTGGRDGAQAFYTLQDNSRMDMPSTLAAGTVWSALQFVANLAMDYLAPDSGAGHAMSQPLPDAFLNCTVANATTLQAADPAVGQESVLYDMVCASVGLLAPLLATTASSVVRGAINAVPEIVDDQLRQYLSLRNSDDGLRIRAGLRVPTRDQVLSTVFTTNAARTTVFNNIYAIALATNTALGPQLPKDIRGALVQSGIVSLTCLLAYVPLVHAHETRPATPAPPPVETTGVHRRVATTEV